MSDYNLATAAQVPQGGRAYATIDTFDSGVAADIDSLTAVWKDNLGVTLATQTRTVSDVTGTDIWGNAVRLIDETGTGVYRSDLVIDLTNYSPTVAGLRWTLTLTAIKGGQSSAPQTFPFYIVPSSVTVALDQTAITAAVMRQLKLYDEVMHVAKDTNAIIPLRANIVYGITSAYKNGVAMTLATDYVWQVYRSNVQVIPAPAINDHYLFTIQTKSSAFVSDVVSRYTEEVFAHLRPHFDTASLMQSPTVAELVKALVIGELRMELVTGTALDSAIYRTGSETAKQARKLIINLQRGEANAYDTAGTALPRVDGAIVGGYLHPDGPFVDRLGLQDRAQRFTGLYVSLNPDPILATRRTSLTAPS